MKNNIYPAKKIPRQYKRNYLLLVFSLLYLFSACTQTTTSTPDIIFTVSMENLNTHYFQVTMDCQGINAEFLDFRMPVWTPGYYWILNFAKNLVNFQAQDEKGNPLEWHKTTLNTWRVSSRHSKKITVSYDVFAYQRSVAEPFLDDGRAFISPTGVFMYIDGRLDIPSKVVVKPYHEWNHVSTGLDQIHDEDHTFTAHNFDRLYDCPILVGNQEILNFEVDQIPYTIAIENPGEFDRQTYIGDLKKLVKSATGIIGDIPYKHYTFLIMHRGYGGLEHSNSMAVFSNTNDHITKSRGYKDWLAFIAHEFFHLYNVKAIRPMALGPFDYSRENLTHMLWVSEGFTVYYEYIILNRAGLLSRDEVFDRFSRVISNFENAPGRPFQSATQSSYDTWLNFFNRNNHTYNTTISYYDIGCALGILLDLKIRHETKNQKSLDNVMRTLYFDFYKTQKRGFTDDEFQQMCEQTAGCSLDEIFDYASSTKPFDYPKYFGYAGILINMEPKITNHVGATFQNQRERLVINTIERDSPAWKAGLSVHDEILSVNNKMVSRKELEKFISESMGNEILFTVKRRTGEKIIKVITEDKAARDFQLSVSPNLNGQQREILESWVK